MKPLTTANTRPGEYGQSLAYEIAQAIVGEFVENKSYSCLPSLGKWNPRRRCRQEDERRGYLFVENVDILGVCVIWIFTEAVRYAGIKSKRRG
jgi:hypothetical protein